MDTAVWLLLGLIAAGLIKAFLSDGLARRWLGGKGFMPVLKAALLGAPLPLCSCGVLPAATGLRRAGASKEATVSFLISTPETGVDSISVSYALLGPVMALARVMAALFTAVVTGMAVSFLPEESNERELVNQADCKRCHKDDSVEDKTSKFSKMRTGIHYAFTRLLDDLSAWLVFGIVLAGLMLYFIPPGVLAQWGTGFAALLIMLVIGIPMYICAVASTPIAAALLVAGVSPGAVLVFMLAGPATNIAGLLVVRNELGGRVLAIYLSGIAICSLLFGLGLDWFFINHVYDVTAQMSHAHAVPIWLKLISAYTLLFFAIKPLRNILLKF